MMVALETVKSLQLPDWWIGAGFVRNKVWDHLHGLKKRTEFNDLDVIYFDTSEKFKEKKIEEQLQFLQPSYAWEVTNQATVHLDNQQAPYKNSTDALSRWTESATCVAVTMNSAGELTLTAPHGVSDLLELVVRLTPHPEVKSEVFEKRIHHKGWFEKWSLLKLVRQTRSPKIDRGTQCIKQKTP